MPVEVSMFYPRLEEGNNTRTLIDSWYGYNHNYKIGRGEFFDMENMSSDQYPLLVPRHVRPLLKKGENIHGLLYSDNNLAYLDGTTLYYSLSSYDLSDLMEEPETWQTLIRFGAYILIFPSNVYINVYDPTDRGTLEDTYIAEEGNEITYSICNSEGEGFDNIVASDDSPSDPTDGMYWLKTSADQGLYVWNKDTWVPVATCYIRIEIPGADLTTHFSEGDVVRMNTTLDDINDGSIIQAMDDEYLVVIGIMDEVTKTAHCTDAWKLTIKRKIPQLDYVCADKNRIWGCHYGYQIGGMINEIYCSKLGDFKNWYSYAGLSTDSYSVSVGVPGEFTGCISYQGYPTFFKENAIFKVYGTMPSQYQIVQSDQRGVQQGSYRSLAIVDEYLVYKSPSDICVYDGSSPVSISENLGREELFYDAVGGGCLNKYRVVMENAKGKKYYFVYDFKTGIWEKEDPVKFEMFSATENGQIYGATKEEIYGLGSTDNIAFTDMLVGEEYVEWFCQTGEMGYEYVDYKYVNRITIRAYVPYRSELEVMIAYDDRDFERVSIVRGKESIDSVSLSFAPFRCDHFRIKLRGHGECRIYSMAISLETGSEEDDNR